MRTCVVVFLFAHLTAGAQAINIRSIRNEDTDFRKYGTFYWAAQVEHQADEESFFLGDLLLKADIRAAIHMQLDDRGYQLQNAGPDMIVNFRIFDKPVTLSGLEGYGRNYWKREELFSTIDNTNDIKIDAGTLIISLLDRDNGSLVWQGFASGLIAGEDFTKDEIKIREAITLLFEEYGARVNEHTRR